MTINGQTMYATVPTLAPPGTPTSAPPRVQYQIQSGSQFTYAQPPPQQEHQSQQWIAIQPQQMVITAFQCFIPLFSLKNDSKNMIFCF